VVAPVFLLTAVSALIGALNARLEARRRPAPCWKTSSRARERAEAGAARDELAQIGRRIRNVYLAILFAVLSALFVCLLIAGAFIGAMLSAELTRTIAALFVVAMLALTASLLLFLREIFLAVSTPRHVPK
jgi:hypothetical protein